MTPERLLQSGDCLRWFPEVADGSIDLAVTDPPYNLGRNYDDYDDQRPVAEYLAWAKQWLEQLHRVLQPQGSFWLAMGDGLVSELDVLCKSLGFHKRGQIIWAFTFGMNCQRNFTRAHTHWLYYTKHKKKFVFNELDPTVRVPSARQLVYNDKRAHPRGRLPDDVWVLRKEELDREFGAYDKDVWIQSRVCGTFKERVPNADNQLPLALVDRIIRTTSVAGQWVLDPFMGVGSVGVAAVQAGRNFHGMELSQSYFQSANRRLDAALAALAGEPPTDDAPVV
jgi:site-specific DNA-methyltransferase (adenine-specific)